MKKLKDVILEKLNVKNLNLDVTKEKYTYDEFIDLISDIIDIDITKNDFHTCVTYYLSNAELIIEDIRHSHYRVTYSGYHYRMQRQRLIAFC